MVQASAALASSDAQVKITGGKITATGGEFGAGIGGGFKGSGDVTITGGEMVAIIQGREPRLVEDAYASTRGRSPFPHWGHRAPGQEHPHRQ